jgi:lysophospholipase L1-like esterase
LREEPLEPAVLEFSPGDASLAESERKKLGPLVARWIDSDTASLTLSHELGEADVSRLRILANPSREECLDMIQRLRQRTAEEQKRREVLAAQVPAAMGTGLELESRELLTKLRDLDRDLGLRERALDLAEDGLHLSAEGYRLWSRLLLPHLGSGGSPKA